jgi:hypothetical protein
MELALYCLRNTTLHGHRYRHGDVVFVRAKRRVAEEYPERPDAWVLMHEVDWQSNPAWMITYPRRHKSLCLHSRDVARYFAVW